MVEFCVNPISKTSARDILKALIMQDERFARIPTREDAERISAELLKERRWYVRPLYLYTVWLDSMK